VIQNNKYTHYTKILKFVSLIILQLPYFKEKRKRRRSDILHTHTHTRARARAHTHTHAHTPHTHIYKAKEVKLITSRQVIETETRCIIGYITSISGTIPFCDAVFVRNIVDKFI